MNIRNLILIIFITAIILLAGGTRITLAQTSSPAPTDASPSVTTFIDKLKQIELLKEKIATKVTQIRQNEKSGVGGTIKSLGDTTITLTTLSKEQTVSYSEDTIFFKMTDAGKSDPLDVKQAKKLKIGDELAILGYFDTAHTSFSAKYIYMFASPQTVFGKIADKDTANYTITVTTPKGNMLVDIETYTKIWSYTKKGGLARGGFSKLKQNDTVHVFATANPKEDNRFSANKIISLNFESATPSATPTASSDETSPSAAPKNK